MKRKQGFGVGDRVAYTRACQELGCPGDAGMVEELGIHGHGGHTFLTAAVRWEPDNAFTRERLSNIRVLTQGEAS